MVDRRARLMCHSRNVRGTAERSSAIGFAAALSVLAGLLSVAGCDQREKVFSYTVAKPPAPVRPASMDRGMDRAAHVAPTGEPGRMLGAIVPHGEKTWFFKLTGPSDAVVELAQSFLTFLRSLRFEGEAPRWDRPEGWTEKPGNEFRFATLEIESATGPLELTISPLPTGEGDFKDQLLANVNRWRGQMQVGPLEPAELEKATLTLDVGDLTVWLVNIEGRLGSTGMGSRTAGGTRDSGATPARAEPRELPALPFTFQLPEGWARKPAGPMRVAEFVVKEGERQVTISASVAGGDLVANVNRWRGQIGLEPIEEAALRESLRKIEVGQRTGDYAELIGPETDKPAQAIFGVIVPVDKRQWFFKLQGDADLARREQPRFAAFAKSIQFGNRGGGTDGQ